MPIHANVRVESALSQGQSQDHVTDGLSSIGQARMVFQHQPL